MTPEHLATLRRAREAATGGTWRPLPSRDRALFGVHGPECVVYHVQADDDAVAQTRDRMHADAAFIALAANEWLPILDEIERLRGALAKHKCRVPWCGPIDAALGPGQEGEHA